MSAKRITFPREEWKNINSLLDETGQVYTTRVDRDTDYAVGDKLETRLGQKRRKLIVSSAKNYTDLKKHPFRRHLTPKQLKVLERYDHYRILKLKNQVEIPRAKIASLQPPTIPMPNNSQQSDDASQMIAADRLGGAVAFGGIGALGGGLLGAKTMLDKTFEDYKADRLAWSQRKQRARERGEDTKTIDRERPGWVMPYLKAAIKGGLIGGTVGGLGGAGAGALSGPSLMRAAAHSAGEKHRERMREKYDRLLSQPEKSSSFDREISESCFRYVHRLYEKEAGIGETVSQGITKVRGSLQDKEMMKKLLRATILGAGGAVAGGAAGSLLKTKGIDYGQYGRPKRKSRAGTGAMLGGAAGATLGLLADSKHSFPMER